MRHHLLPLVALLLLSACDDGDPGDAGARDASVDASLDSGIDAATPDAGSLDAGSLDAGPRDADATTASAREAASVFFVGHSLVNFHMPAMLDDVARSLGLTHVYGAEIGVGSPLHWIWNYPDDTDGDDAHLELPTGRYDVLVLTELIPVREHVMYSDTTEYVRRYYELAMSGNPATQVYFYETWYSVEDPAWSQNIAADRAVWEGVIDDVNAMVDGPDILLVPGGTAMARLVQRMEAGGVPGLDSRFDLYVDPIHLTDIGNYFIALVQLATIYRRSPVGATAMTDSEFGVPFTAPSPEAARIMQEIAWEVVSQDPRAGVAPRGAR